MSRGYDYQEFSVLYVDDEAQALKYFAKAYAGDFRVLTATSAADAWKLIESPENKVAVVITDQRMPAETGVDLLERIRANRPDIVRILTTAYSDLKSAIDAVNAGGAFRYIAKPWDVADVKGVLLRAMEFFLVKRDRDRLLREKLSVFQRMILMDRIRGLAVLAAALGCRLQNSLGALRDYIGQAPLGAEPPAGIEDSMQCDLWSLARSEGEKLVSAVREVLESTAPLEARFGDTVDAGKLVDEVVAQLGPKKQEEGVVFRVKTTAGIGPIKADASLVKRLLSILIERICEMDGEDRAIEIEAAPATLEGGAPGVRLSVRGEGPAWRENQVAALYSAVITKGSWLLGIDMDVLAAYFIAHHHGGSLRVNPAGPSGPGFEVLLAGDPAARREGGLSADWFDEVFSRLEQQE
jgi:two-component system probable response regulator PhcQ